MSITPYSLFEALTEGPPLRLNELPKLHGIYALWDHTGQVRYIGSTPNATDTFDKRIGSKHVTGSEGSSHKFSHAYCTGSMWRFYKRLYRVAPPADLCEADSKIARALRAAFIREYCRATVVPISTRELSGPYKTAVTKLEYAVQRLAPPEMRMWETLRFQPMDEPQLLVQDLLIKHPHWAEAATRQRARWLAFQGR